MVRSRRNVNVRSSLIERTRRTDGKLDFNRSAGVISQLSGYMIIITQYTPEGEEVYRTSSLYINVVLGRGKGVGGRGGVGAYAFVMNEREARPRAFSSCTSAGG